jgi:hypothetical protein
MINMWTRGVFLLLLLSTTCTKDFCLAASDLPVTVIEGEKEAPVRINLAEDEVILPPYLMRFEGGPKMNVTPAQKQPRSVSPKELLDFGDSFRLLPRLCFQLIGREKFQWVGGGVFEGRLFGPLIDKGDSPYGFQVDRGWAKVWADEPDSGVRVETPNGRFTARTATFWMYVQNGETEVYLLSGELRGPDGSTPPAGSYLRWKTGQKAPAIGRKWTREGLEAKIKGVYPALLALARQADEDWDGGDPAKIFSEIRKKGWRKASRGAPH